jgi:hypothetical protein
MSALRVAKDTLRRLALSLGGVLALLALPVCLTADDTDAPEQTPEIPQYARLAELPFPPGEKIHYNLRWSFFDVAKATMSIEGPVEYEGAQVWRIVLEAQTNSFADKIFKVRDYNAAWVDLPFTHPVYYVKNQNEGSTHREVVVTFDWGNNTAQYSDHGKARDPITILPGSWDPLSVTYAVRALDFTGLETILVPSTDGKRSSVTEVEIGEVETIRVPAGSFEAIVLRPDTKNLGGVFRKSDRANIVMWFTNDARHIPIRVESEVAVGSFVAEMESLEGPGSEPYNPPPENEQPPRPPRRRGR